MGFYEDDRIRRKNASKTREGITNNDMCLKLGNVSISDMVDLLTNNGYKVELKSNQTISIDRKPSGGEKINHDNRITSTI
jgi:hypothetical protein